MTSLTKIPVSMIDPEGASLGSVPAVVDSDTPVMQLVDPAQATPTVTVSQLSYDSASGTLTFSMPDGSLLKASGFPTIDQMREGKEGATGRDGLAGRAGANGKDGRDGSRGCTGPKGDQGRPGPVGPTGPVGQTGPTGATGPIGPTGPEGPKGKDAATWIYEPAPLVDPLTQKTVPYAFIASNVDPNTGYVRNFGRHIASAKRDTVHVVFSKPFLNKCVNLQLTFVNPLTNQARTYALYHLDLGTGTMENFLLGGFTLQSTGVNAQSWDFFWEAEGD